MAKKMTTAEIHDHLRVIFSERGPMTYRVYAGITGLREGTAFCRLRKAWDAKLLYIESYERSVVGPPIPLYALGGLPDAPRPDPLTPTERARKYQATPKGKETMRGLQRKRRAELAKRRQEDPDYAAAMRKKWREKSRAMYGHLPRTPSITSIAKANPALAILTKGLK